MNNIAYNLSQIRNKITFATIRSKYTSKVSLIAISKNQPISAIEKAIEANQMKFGENYVQEGVTKIRHFQKLGVKLLQWHFVGSVQANKSRLVAEYFDWCHTIDRMRIATRLNEHRPKKMGPLNVLIQVNVTNEHSKSGVVLTEIKSLASKVITLQNLKLRGLMSIPALELNYEKHFAVLKQIAVAFRTLKSYYQSVDTLSLGMSNDLEAAIAVGSTMVRIGTAIFGARDCI